MSVSCRTCDKKKDSGRQLLKHVRTSEKVLEMD